MIRPINALPYDCPGCEKPLAELVDDSGGRGIGCTRCDVMVSVRSITHKSMDLAIIAMRRILSRRTNQMPFNLIALLQALSPLLSGEPSHPHAQEAKTIAHAAIEQHNQPVNTNQVALLQQAIALLTKASTTPVPTTAPASTAAPAPAVVA